MSASTAGLTLAALPDVHVGSGTTASCTSTNDTTSSDPENSSVPASVQPDGTAAFFIWAKNCDTSTVSQFFLSINPAANVQAILDPSTFTADPRCSTAVDPQCTFGQVKPQGEIHLVVIVQAPSTEGPFDVSFTWTTTGIGHGDNFTWYDSAVVDSHGGNYAGTFTYDPSLTEFTIANSPIDALGGTGGNQSTSATVATQNIPVTVRDGHDWTPPTGTTCESNPTVTCPDGLFGEWSTVNVNNGDGSVTIVITIDGSLVPNGTNAKNLVVYHNYLDSDGNLQTETITDSCGSAPCRDVSIARGSDPIWTITIQTDHNGNISLY